MDEKNKHLSQKITAMALMTHVQVVVDHKPATQLQKLIKVKNLALIIDHCL